MARLTSWVVAPLETALRWFNSGALDQEMTMPRSKYKGPPIYNPRAITTHEEACRVGLFVSKLGSRDKAAKKLGVGLLTLEQAAITGGTMLAKTKAKLCDALAREEAA